MGRALPGVHLSIRDASLAPLAPGQEARNAFLFFSFPFFSFLFFVFRFLNLLNQKGEICASGPNIFLRYRHLPEVSNQFIRLLLFFFLSSFLGNGRELFF